MSTELVEYEGTQDLAPVNTGTLFGTDDPDAVVERASKVAGSLAKVVRAQKLAVGISGREHVRVEGWTLLGSMLGVFPVVTEDHKLATDGGGWEAYVQARTRGGEIVGGAWGQCTRSEKAWANRDDYAIRSMAQTRATSKALRMPLGFVMALAGFESTPAEEMSSDFAPPKKDTAKATKTQLDKITKLVAERVASGNSSQESFDKYLYETYSATELGDLNKKEAEELLTLLEGGAS